MKYRKVGPRTFEKQLKLADQRFINKKREYDRKVCYLDKDGKSGFALTEDGALCHVFSLVKGRGRVAVATALSMGANRLSCFGPDLVEYYKKFGFHLCVIEPQKSGLDKHWMCHKPNMQPKVVMACL